MKTLKLLFCACVLALVACASSEPVVQEKNTDEVRAHAAEAYQELDAEQVGN